MITIEKLLEGAQRSRGPKKAVIHKLKLNEFDDEIEVEIPTPSELDEYTKDEKDIDKNMRELIYNFTINPKLSDDRLVKGLNCENTPSDVVAKVLSEETIVYLGNYLVKQSNELLKKYSVERVVDIKNS